jgi:hypothetical protein
VNDSHARTERAHLRPRGSSQGGLRQYNERVVLQAIRLHGALPGAEIARLTGLTAQTVSMITKSLIDDGYLRKGAPVRGKVGQPSVPLSLAPDGAYSIGIKVGRRRLDTLLIDFNGKPCARWSLAYAFPTTCWPNCASASPPSGAGWAPRAACACRAWDWPRRSR